MGGRRGPGLSFHWRWLVRLWLVACVSCVALSPAAATDAQQPSRSDVEAAYLYNFGKFVRWPATASQGPMSFCIAADDGFADRLQRLVAGDNVNGRVLKVRQVARADDARGCSILFIAGDVPYLDGLLLAVKKQPVLTVGDAADFERRGGAIQFVLQDEHVRFEVNLAAAERNGLKLSSELLKVAVKVRTTAKGVAGQ